MGMEKKQFLNKYELDFSSAWEYTLNTLDDANALSIELLKLLDFKEGYFFTLLPEDSNFERLYEFKAGVILPQFPVQEQIIDEKKITFSRIPNRRKELSEMILKAMNSKPQFSCIFDDVRGRPHDKWSDSSFDLNLMFYQEDVYFLLNKNNISLERICKCLKMSCAIWHSLCVITSADFANIERLLTLEKIQEICLNVELVIVGAYDGEGYIFWEKNTSKENNGFFFSD
jgi:hypothetical protein